LSFRTINKQVNFLFLLTIMGIGATNLMAQNLEQDSIALDSLYKSANGEMWNSNWGPGVPLSEWDGVTVENGRVEGLSLDISQHNNLTGTISTSLYLLDGLKTINLRSLSDLTDIIDFSFMPQLEHLMFNNCDSLELKNFEVLVDLDILDIRNMPLYHEIHYEDLINLSTLRVYKSNLEVLFGFENLVNLEVLILGFNSISTIPSLENNLVLKEIDFGVNPLTELPEIGHLSELMLINIQDIGLQEVPDLSTLPNLTSLSAASNEISEFPDLSNNTKLVSINLGTNNISEVPKIEGLDDLNFLQLAANSIIDIDVSGLQDIGQIVLRNNKLKTIKGVEVLTGLTSLELDSNELDSLQDLTNLTNLNNLDLSFNNLSMLPDLPNGLENLNFDVIYNNLAFSELERIEEHGFVNLNLSYAPQFPNLSTNNNAPPIFGDSLMLTIPNDGVNSSYTWYKNDEVIPGLVNLTEPTLILDTISLLDKGFYQCEVSNSQYTGHSYRSDSLEYETMTPQSTRDSLRMEFDASVVDQCLCGDFLELWQFDSLAFKPIEFDSLGTTVFLTDLIIR